jgi:hypothetical protein
MLSLPSVGQNFLIIGAFITGLLLYTSVVNNKLVVCLLHTVCCVTQQTIATRILMQYNIVVLLFVA